MTVLALVAGLYACKDEDKNAAQGAGNAASTGALLVVTERESTDGSSLHYLHVLKEWPSSGELDYGNAVELGEPGVAFVQDGAFFFYHAQAGIEEKITVDKNLEVTRGEDNDNEISFLGKGISGFDAEPVRVSSDVAFMVDEKSAQIARWNPKTMELGAVEPMKGDDVLERDGLKVQFQLGVAAKKRVFTTANWRSWDTNTIEPYAALATFNQDSPSDLKVIQDDRCAPSVAVGPFTDQDYIYLVSDGTQGFDILASPKKVEKPQCIVRMRTDADAFDKDYFIDLQELTKSPAIYMAFPMADHKVLVSLWSPDEDVAKYMTTKDAGWFWDRPPTYSYVIVDLLTKKLTEVKDLPLGSARSPKVLIVDGENYVQLFDGDRGSTMYRVTTDGKAKKVLTSPGSTNVQFLGRL